MRPALTLILAYIGFISLGLPDTVLGAAWPAMRNELNLRLDAAGGAVLLTSAGVVLSSTTNAFLRARVGTAVVLVGSTSLAALALGITALAPSFAVVLAAAFLAGLGGGGIDTALNDHVARHHGARHMNWLHASWGVGAALAPAVVAATLHTGHSWRWSYAALAATELTLGVSFLLTRKAWDTSRCFESDDHRASHSVRIGLSRRRVRRVLLFFFYTGVEAGMGLWSASWLIATRGASAARAGSAVALYWAGLTAGRLFVGLVVGRVSPARILRMSWILALLMLVVLALPRTPLLIAQLCLPLLGFALAPVFPLLMHETPQRFPGAEGAQLMGYQIAGASAGVATLPWLLGFTGRTVSAFAIMPLAALLLMIALVLARQTEPHPPLPIPGKGEEARRG